MQARLNLRMIEQIIVLATRHKREASHIGKHRPIPILAIEAEQRAFLWELMGSQIPANGRDPLAQFLPVASVPTVAETAEPLITVLYWLLRMSNPGNMP